MKNNIRFASAALALIVLPGSWHQAQAQTSDKQVVRCVYEYSPGYRAQNMSCGSWALGYFTTVPAGKHFSITEVTLVPYGDANSVTGISLQRVLPTALYEYFPLRHMGGSSITHTWRTPPLVLTSGTNLQVSSWWNTTTSGMVIVTGILSSEYNAAVR